MRNALFLTGAAARISQEVAIVDLLIDQKQLKISSHDTFLAGFSSGALNIAAINACFRNENPLSWNDYYKNEILFNISSNMVYNKHKSLPYNTMPLRKTIENFILHSGFNLFADLSFISYILAFPIRRLSVKWINNMDPDQKNIFLTDLLMATTAIPMVFPDQEINTPPGLKSNLPSGGYLDGGTTGSFTKFKKPLNQFVKEHGVFDQLYIISPMRELSLEDYEEFNALLPGKDIIKLKINEFGIFKDFLGRISMNGFDSFIKQFYKWTSSKQKPIANEIFVCIPAPTLCLLHWGFQLYVVVAPRNLRVTFKAFPVGRNTWIDFQTFVIGLDTENVLANGVKIPRSSTCKP
jgi:hypothetical protein